MWVARDKDRELNFFSIKPVRRRTHWCIEGVFSGYSCKLDPSLFPDLTWDDEALKVELSETTKHVIYPDGVLDDGDFCEMESMCLGYRTEDGGFVYY